MANEGQRLREGLQHYHTAVDREICRQVAVLAWGFSQPGLDRQSAVQVVNPVGSGLRHQIVLIH